MKNFSQVNMGGGGELGMKKNGGVSLNSHKPKIKTVIVSWLKGGCSF